MMKKKKIEFLRDYQDEKQRRREMTEVGPTKELAGPHGRGRSLYLPQSTLKLKQKLERVVQ